MYWCDEGWSLAYDGAAPSAGTVTLQVNVVVGIVSVNGSACAGVCSYTLAVSAGQEVSGSLSEDGSSGQPVSMFSMTFGFVSGVVATETPVSSSDGEIDCGVVTNCNMAGPGQVGAPTGWPGPAGWVRTVGSGAAGNQGPWNAYYNGGSAAVDPGLVFCNSTWDFHFTPPVSGDVKMSWQDTYGALGVGAWQYGGAVGPEDDSTAGAAAHTADLGHVAAGVDAVVYVVSKDAGCDEATITAVWVDPASDNATATAVTGATQTRIPIDQTAVGGTATGVAGSWTSTPSASGTPTPTGTQTPDGTGTAVAAGTQTQAPADTATAVAQQTASAQPTATASATVTPFYPPTSTPGADPNCPYRDNPPTIVLKNLGMCGGDVYGQVPTSWAVWTPGVGGGYCAPQAPGNYAILPNDWSVFCSSMSLYQDFSMPGDGGFCVAGIDGGTPDFQIRIVSPVTNSYVTFAKDAMGRCVGGAVAGERIRLVARGSGAFYLDAVYYQPGVVCQTGIGTYSASATPTATATGTPSGDSSGLCDGGPAAGGGGSQCDNLVCQCITDGAALIAGGSDAISNTVSAVATAGAGVPTEIAGGVGALNTLSTSVVSSTNALVGGVATVVAPGFGALVALPTAIYSETSVLVGGVATPLALLSTSVYSTGATLAGDVGASTMAITSTALAVASPIAAVGQFAGDGDSLIDRVDQVGPWIDGEFTTLEDDVTVPLSQTVHQLTDMNNFLSVGGECINLIVTDPCLPNWSIADSAAQIGVAAEGINAELVGINAELTGINAELVGIDVGQWVGNVIQASNDLITAVRGVALQTGALQAALGAEGLVAMQAVEDMVIPSTLSGDIAPIQTAISEKLPPFALPLGVSVGDSCTDPHFAILGGSGLDLPLCDSGGPVESVRLTARGLVSLLVLLWTAWELLAEWGRMSDGGAA